MSTQDRKPNRNSNMFGQRFIAGSWSAFAAIIVIAIAVFANLIVRSIPTAFTEMDMTANSLYSLSNQTKQIIATLDKDVKLYLLATNGSEDATITRLLNQYSSLSSHIKVENVDPNEKPTFLKNYKLEASRLYQNSVIVDSGERHRLVGYNDIFVTNYSVNYQTYQYETTTSFAGENAITNAIHYVTRESLPKVYILKGHGEDELSDNITNMIKQDNMEVSSLSLLTMNNVPEDAAAVFINNPSSDLGDDETEMLIAYLQKGGRAVLLTDYIEQGKMTNLLKVTQAMGMTVQQGIIIEGDNNMHISRYPHYILPEIADHDITNTMKKAGYYILSPVAQPIVETETKSGTVTWLLTTSASSFAKQAALDMKTAEKEDGDSDGPFHVGAVSENGGKMIWFSSGHMLESDVDRTVAGGNSNLLLNALNWLSGREENISIRVKSINEEKLTVPAASYGFWSTVMIGVLPGALISIGIVIYIRRKRR